MSYDVTVMEVVSALLAKHVPLGQILRALPVIELDALKGMNAQQIVSVLTTAHKAKKLSFPPIAGLEEAVLADLAAGKSLAAIGIDVLGKLLA